MGVDLSGRVAGVSWARMGIGSDSSRPVACSPSRRHANAVSGGQRKRTSDRRLRGIRLPSAREDWVPVAGPRIAKGESEALVYLYDLFPTLAQLTTQQPVYSNIDGVDLSGIIAGTEDAVRTWLFTAYTDQIRAVRDARWKLIRYPELHHTQLFDLATDPHELNDLAQDEAQQERVASLMNELAAWQAHFGDPHPLTTAVPRSMVIDYSTVERVPDRHQPQWVVET